MFLQVPYYKVFQATIDQCGVIAMWSNAEANLGIHMLIQSLVTSPRNSNPGLIEKAYKCVVLHCMSELVVQRGI